MARKLKCWVKLWILYEAIFVPLALLVGGVTLITGAAVVIISSFALICFGLIGELLRKTEKILPIKNQEPQQPDFSAAFAMFDKTEVKQ